MLHKEYLNCGCGPNFKEGFINLDWGWMPGIDLCWDVTRGLPFSDGSLKGIYTEHMLEHLAFSEALPLFIEFRRVLRPGGLLRIVVPDAELYLDLYQAAKKDRHTVFPYAEFASDATPMMHVNRIFRDSGHRYGYDYETLALLLSRAGFSSTKKLSFGQGGDPRLLIDFSWRKIESLYVEASP